MAPDLTRGRVRTQYSTPIGVSRTRVSRSVSHEKRSIAMTGDQLRHRLQEFFGAIAQQGHPGPGLSSMLNISLVSIGFLKRPTGFSIAEKESIPPSGSGSATLLKTPTIPDGYRPRGSPSPAATPRAKFNSDPKTMHPRRNRKPTTPMPMLHAANPGRAQPL